MCCKENLKTTNENKTVRSSDKAEKVNIYPVSGGEGSFGLEEWRGVSRGTKWYLIT